MNQHLVALLMTVILLVAGCDSRTLNEIRAGVKATGTITDAQLKRLSELANRNTEGEKKINYLDLSGLTSLTNAQAARLNKVPCLHLDGLTTITDEQAESLCKRRMGADNVDFLWLNGLTTITDEQAESLSKNFIYISPDLRPLIDKYRNK